MLNLLLWISHSQVMVWAYYMTRLLGIRAIRVDSGWNKCIRCLSHAKYLGQAYIRHFHILGTIIMLFFRKGTWGVIWSMCDIQSPIPRTKRRLDINILVWYQNLCLYLYFKTFYFQLIIISHNFDGRIMNAQFESGIVYKGTRRVCLALFSFVISQ